MPAVLSPQPLAARLPRFSSAVQLVPTPPIYDSSFPMSPHAPPQRLMSPIQLAPSIARPSSVISKSISHPTPRRRSKPSSRPPRRRRPLLSVDHPIGPAQHLFDQLPWISALEATPDHFNPWNIADLSQFHDYSSSTLPISGPGPIRSRKSSPRSNPLASSLPTRPTSPLCDTPTRFHPPSSPSTPRPRFDPSRVLFCNLMPVSCDSPNDKSTECTFRSSHH